MVWASPSPIPTHLFGGSAALPAPPPPIQFDRIIAATAKIHRLALITRDANITDSGAVDTLW